MRRVDGPAGILSKIKVERDRAEPIEGNASAEVRRLLLRGHPVSLNRGPIAHSAVHDVVRLLRALGFVIEVGPRSETDDDVVARLTNPDHTPDDGDIAAYLIVRNSKGTKKSRAKKTTGGAVVPIDRTRRPKPPPAPTLPDIGATVTIYALVHNRDGTYVMGFRDETHSWMTQMMGVTSEVRHDGDT